MTNDAIPIRPISPSAAGDGPVWILGAYDVLLPPACTELLSMVIRVEAACQPVPSRGLSAAAVHWDRARVERAEANSWGTPTVSLQSAVSRITNEPAPVIVSLGYSCAFEIFRLLGREVYWISIDGRGATDRSAVWMSWLSSQTSFVVMVTRVTDAGPEEFARREFRHTLPTPALGHWQALRGSAIFIDAVCADQRARVVAAASVPVSPRRNLFAPDGPVGRQPSTGKVLRRILHNRIRGRLRPTGPDRWAIGIAPRGKDLTRLPQPPQPAECHWMEYRGSGFVADPFLMEFGERTLLFFEELDYSNWRGRLKSIVLDREGRAEGPPTIVLEKPYHLSFPNVFRCADDPTGIYLLPEQGAAGCTALYRAGGPVDNEPLAFALHATLLDDFPGVDPVLHWSDPYWWLFVTNGSHGNHDNNLHLFMARALRGPYIEHPSSPIRLGLRGSRMAGQLLTHDGGLFRVGQNCQRRYGEKIIMFRIEELTAVGYRETEIHEFGCDTWGPKFAGIHSLSFTSSFVAIDVLFDDR